MYLIAGIMLYLFALLANAHEQWLLTAEQIKILKEMPAPLLFSHLTWFNVLFTSLYLIGIGSWIFLTLKFKQIPRINKISLSWGAFFLRIFLGLMLILCSLGLVPKEGLPFFSQTTLLAPDLIAPSSPFLFWLQLGIGIALILGLYTPIMAVSVLLLIAYAVVHYGSAMFQYIGFYLGAVLFLLFQRKNANNQFNSSNIKISLLLLQILTGLNFIYSAISVKWLHPNETIAIFEIHKGFTFGIPYPEFVFIMLLTEISFGVLFILGWHLRWLSLILLGLFIFLSITLGENVLSHCFIYGILILFIFVEGVPLNQLFNKKI